MPPAVPLIPPPLLRLPPVEKHRLQRGGCRPLAAAAGYLDTDQDITVGHLLFEDGSGTRGAFIELTGVEEKNADGKKVDNTTEAAAIQSSTNGVMTAAANDETAIGYISLGS